MLPHEANLSHYCEALIELDVLVCVCVCDLDLALNHDLVFECQELVGDECSVI